MTRANITLGILKEISEVEPGDFRNVYDELKNVNSTVKESGVTKSDGKTLNPNSIYDTTLSFIIPNDKNNRIFNIEYVMYLGNKYKVKSIRFNRPRIEIVLGGIWNE